MAIIGHGSKFSLGSGSGSPETYTDIAGCTSIDLGSSKIDTPETTAMDSAGTFKQYIAGLEDPGEISAKFNVIPGDTSQAALFAAKDSTTKDIKVTYPGAVRTISFQGIITGIDESIPDDKPATFSVKVKVTGAKTYATGS